MSKTYSWQINSLFVAPTEGSLTNVVKKVNWRFQVAEGNSIGEIFGVTDLSEVSEGDFTEYDNLSKDTIISWVKSVEDYDSMVAMVDEKLAEAKQPSLVESNPPFQEDFFFGEDQYVVVVDGEFNNASKRFGPIYWESDKINAFLSSLDMTDELPDNLTCLKTQIIPRNAPLVINDRVKVYKATITQFDSDGIHENIKYHIGELQWQETDGILVGSYPLIERSEEQLRSIVSSLLVQKRNQSLHTPLDVVVGERTFTTYTDMETFTTYSSKINLMTDGDTVNWKFVNGWFEVSKQELLEVFQKVDEKIQQNYEDERSMFSQLELCSGAEEIVTFYNENLRN